MPLDLTPILRVGAARLWVTEEEWANTNKELGDEHS